MIKKKKIIFLSSFLHSGIDWVHSLLDSHQNILITPALSFYRCWTKFGFNEMEYGQKIYNKFYLYIKINIGPSSKNEQKKFLNNNEELDDFFFKLGNLLKNNLVSRRDVFLYIHESYLYAKKINEKNIKVIISHEHVPFYKNLFKSDFPDSSIILVLRDPRAALAGIWHRRTELFGHLPDFTFNMTIDCWFYGISIIKDKNYKQEKNLYILKNEELHSNIQKEMTKLAKWLKVDFTDTLLIESFPSGKKVFVDSAYLMGNKPNDQNLLNQKIPDDYFKIDKVVARWKSVLSKQQIIMIEGIFSIIFNNFGYKRIYANTLSNKIRSFYFYIIPQKKLFNYWFQNYPEIESFKRIHKRLDVQKNFFLSKIWYFAPSFIKFLCLVFYSMFSRVKIFLSSKEKIPEYDRDKITIK